MTFRLAAARIVLQGGLISLVVMSAATVCFADNCPKAEFILRVDLPAAVRGMQPSQRERAVRALFRELQIEKVAEFERLGINLFAAKRPANRVEIESVDAALRRLNHTRRVRYAVPNAPLTPAAPPNDGRFGEQWALHNTDTPGMDINALPAWDLPMGGSDVVVAVLDSGVETSHLDLKGHLLEGWNAVDCNTHVDDDQEFSHGTRVAGIIAAVGNNDSNSIAGVAWPASIRILPCKCLGATGSRLQDALTCLAFVKQKIDSHTMRIAAVNLSWTTPTSDVALRDAIRVLGPIGAAPDDGTLVVAAAGNGGVDLVMSPQYPAALTVENLITVTAMKKDGATANDSNHSRFRAHLQAPGDKILSTVRGNTYDADLGKTSMAAPHVAGVAALLVANDPSLDWQAVRDRILASAVPDNSETITGGHVDAYAALKGSKGPVVRRLFPNRDVMSVSPGNSVLLSVLSINSGIVPVVTVEPGGAVVSLSDDGSNLDEIQGDGIYSAKWIRPGSDVLTLNFPDGSKVTINP